MIKPFLVSVALLLVTLLLGCQQPPKYAFVYHEAPECNAYFKVVKSKCDDTLAVSLFRCKYTTDDGAEHESPEAPAVGSTVCLYVE